MTCIQYIDLDMSIPTNPIVYSKTGDTARQVVASLYNQGVEWDVPSGATGVVYAKDCAGNTFSSNTVSFEDNQATITLPTFTSIGLVPTEIQITASGVVSTFNFKSLVYKSA